MLFFGNDECVTERFEICKEFAKRLSEALFQSDISLASGWPTHLESPPDAIEETPTWGDAG
jgi:hypothetical protein